MTTADFMQLLDQLWPDNALPDAVTFEMGRRLESLPLSHEQVKAALTEYRLTCPKYEVRTPDAGTVMRMLRAKAYPASEARQSAGDSTVREDKYVDHIGPDGRPVYGRPVGFSEWRAYAKANRIKDMVRGTELGRKERRDD